MPDLLSVFRRNVETAVEEERRAADSLVHSLKQLTPAEFLNRPFTEIIQLSDRQYREIVAEIAPDVEIPEIEAAMEEPVHIVDWLLEYWRTWSSLSRSIFVGTGLSLLVSASTLAFGPWAVSATTFRAALSRSIDTASWPSCARLSSDTDGCVYLNASEMTWSWAAEQLGMSEHILRRANHTLATPTIRKWSHLIVWRFRKELED